VAVSSLDCLESGLLYGVKWWKSVRKWFSIESVELGKWELWKWGALEVEKAIVLCSNTVIIRYTLSHKMTCALSAYRVPRLASFEGLSRCSFPYDRFTRFRTSLFL
jgi:hypothetical protein